MDERGAGGREKEREGKREKKIEKPRKEQSSLMIGSVWRTSNEALYWSFLIAEGVRTPAPSTASSDPSRSAASTAAAVS